MRNAARMNSSSTVLILGSILALFALTIALLLGLG
jgi:hypothetical protein